MRNFNRREILKTSLTLSGVSALSPFALFAEEKMVHRAIPASGETVPAIGLGSWQTFDIGTDEATRAPRREVLKRFVEMGGSIIDSSPMYGRSEAVLGEMAAELAIQDNLFYATKVWTDGEDAGIAQMERSLERMRVKQMDLMQVHNLVDTATHLKTLRDWKEKGLVRYIGITHWVTGAFGDLEKWMRQGDIDFVQLPFSIATRDAENSLLPLAQELGIATMINRPFEKGVLFRHVKGKPLPKWAKEIGCETWAQFFLRYIVSHPSVTCVIPATSKPKHLVDNMQAGYGELPDNKTREKMASYFADL